LGVQFAIIHNVLFEERRKTMARVVKEERLNLRVSWFGYFSQARGANEVRREIP
jgi:hypothetical protein